MEGSKRKAIFESLNLNPQLFVNEVRNTLDNVVDEAFDFFHQEASTKLNSEDSIQRSENLEKVGKEFEVLNLKIQILEKQSTVNAHYINEAIQLYEQNNFHVLFQGNSRASLHLYIHFWTASTKLYH